MSAVLRPLERPDIDAVRKLAGETSEAPHWTRTQYESLLLPAGSALRQRYALVLAIDGMIGGFAAAQLSSGICELESIVVAPAARRQRAGLRLLEGIHAWARLNGATRFELEVRVSNAAAIALYRCAGLSEEGRRKRYYSQPEEDALLMGRDLDRAGFLCPQADVSIRKEIFRMDEAVGSSPGTEEIEKIQAEHRRCDEQLGQLLQKPYLTAEEQIEQVRLKKLKLHAKDRLMQFRADGH